MDHIWNLRLYDILPILFFLKFCNKRKKKFPEPLSLQIFLVNTLGTRIIVSIPLYIQMPKKILSVFLRIYISPLYMFYITTVELSKLYKVKLNLIYLNHPNTSFINQKVSSTFKPQLISPNDVTFDVFLLYKLNYQRAPKESFIWTHLYL